MSCLLENPQPGLHRDEFKLLRGGGEVNTFNFGSKYEFWRGYLATEKY